ncbi:MAG: hypothetical protein NZ761_09060 [Dehalococcoidia bacterium]|nr:hypothetical protein [Dehalococcoidia bacterium]
MRRRRETPDWEGCVALQVRALGLPEPEREYRFLPGRRFRFDFAWPSARVALEIEGGRFAGGRHVRPEGYARDVVKYSAAAALGWRVIRAVPEQVEDGRAVLLVAAVLGVADLDEALARWTA